MGTWPMRLVGIAIVLIAGYLAYLASHGSTLALLCAGGAAAIAILSVVLLWDRPKLGSAIAAVVLIVGIVANTIVIPRMGSTAQASSPAPAASTVASSPTAAASPQALNSASPPSSVAAGPTPSSMPSMEPATGALSAPQPGDFDYSDFIGHGTIDDGMTSPTYAQGAQHAVGLAAAAFGGPTPTPMESVTAQKLIDADAKLPESEYSLYALAATLPDEPIAVYHFVRDNIAIDPYDGIMRGPLGTWMSRAGSPSDKLSLLAWLLVHKHIHIQFVRGVLSTDERNRIVQSAMALADDTSPQPTPNATLVTTINSYVRDGKAFAQWSSRQLAAAHVTLGAENPSQVSAKHYWIQIDQNGRLLDLDPTLPDMNEGEHLGALDTSFKPWAMLPNDEYHYVRVLVTAMFQDGSQQQVVDGIGKTCDFAYTPIRLAFTPSGGDLSNVTATRTFDVWLIDGSTTWAPKAELDLDAHGGITRVTMEIDRKDTDGQQLASTRDLLSPQTPKQLQGPALAGLTSMLIVPGLGLNAFEVHAFVRTFAAIANAVEGAQNGRMTHPPVYPIPLAEYFASDENVANELTQGTSGRFYRNHTNIVLERTWFAVAAGAPRTVLGFDVVDNSMATVGMDGVQGALANLARGYADTKIEQDVVRGSGTFSTIAVFRSAENPRVIAAGGSAPAAVGNLANGLSETLAAGHVAIAPAGAAIVSNQREYGWWDIDPTTGSAVGRMTGGAGQSLTEYGFLLRVFSLGMDAKELLEAEKECGGEEAAACAEAMCSFGVGSFLSMRTLKHAAHIKSGWALLAAIVMDVGIEVLAQATICGKNISGGGEHGGGESGGGPPEEGPPYQP
jgi:hypothetical protein